MGRRWVGRYLLHGRQLQLQRLGLRHRLGQLVREDRHPEQLHPGDGDLRDGLRAHVVRGDARVGTGGDVVDGRHDEVVSAF